MEKKMVKRKKLKVFRLLLVILVLGGIVLAMELYLNTRIKNITIKGTNYLKDDYILYLANLEDYPSFYYTTTGKIKKKLQKSPYIKKVNIKKGFYHTMTIEVVENNPLFISEIDQKVVLDNQKEVVYTNEISLFRIPRLMNKIPNTKYHSFKKNISKIESSILGKISEITYVPNEFDKDRFLLYMNDGNSVYLTLTKFKMINYYNNVLKQLEGRKGILYLDSGNHFKVME
ncbi:MAG: FtsQ-type POTRA domain-containing protein [Bacilli bacterium]|nr:FtsQ-type POTRA domain-containing protein [Bacilli bacterium]